MHCGQFSTTCCTFLNQFTENKLNEEIDWGLNLRKDRTQEKEIFLAEEPSELNVPPKKKHHKKKRCKKAKEIPLCHKLSEKITFNRNTATFKQYIDILARPKLQLCPPEPEEDKNIPKLCSPRCAQLALPTKARILNNWKDYQDVLSPEQILWLKELLTKEEAILPLDAYNYFKKLDKQKRKQKKLKKNKEKQKKKEKPKKSKVIKEINCLAKCIVKFFSEKMLQTVKCSHIMLTNLMKEKLEENNLIKPGYRRDKNDICGRTLYETLDQLSVWLESIICDEDESEEEGESEESSISTLTYSDLDIESEVSIPEEMAVEEEEEEGEDFFEKLAKEWKEIIEEEKPEAEEEPPIFDVGDLRSVEREELEEEEESERSRFRIADIVRYGEGEGGEEEEEEEEAGEGMIGGKEAVGDQASIDQASVGGPGADESWKLAEDEVEGQKTPSEGEFELEKPPSEGVLADVAQILNDIILHATPSREALRIEEHSPDAMCCVTMKTWATWLVDVAQNTHNWCQWIQEVIAKVRYFAAVLKGEIKTKDGKTKTLYKEEWTQFTEMLAKDIESWQKYNAHVKELSDKIIEGFQDKRVICCSACLKSKLIISADTAHQVTEQLVEALNTTGYWRGWLDAIVTEARKLAALEFQLPSIKDQDESTYSGSLESSLVFELVELKSASTKTSSDTSTSIFYLEEVEDSTKEKKPDDNNDTT